MLGSSGERPSCATFNYMSNNPDPGNSSGIISGNSSNSNNTNSNNSSSQGGEFVSGRRRLVQTSNFGG